MDRVQRVSAALSYQRIIRSFAWRTLGIGLFFLFLAIISPHYLFSMLSMGAVGLWLGLYGIFLLRLPTAQALLLGDRSGIVAFMLSLALVAYEMVVDAPKPGHLPRSLPGVFFVIIGFAFVTITTKRAVKSLPPPLSGNDAAQFKEALTALLQADYQKEPHIVQFTIDKGMVRGELTNTMIVLTADRGSEVYALSREAVELVPDLNGKTRKGIPMRVRVGQNWGKGTIDELSYQRYQVWKARSES
jgi:hypothetical protein